MESRLQGFSHVRERILHHQHGALDREGGELSKNEVGRRPVPPRRVATADCHGAELPAHRPD